MMNTFKNHKHIEALHTATAADKKLQVNVLCHQYCNRWRIYALVNANSLMNQMLVADYSCFLIKGPHCTKIIHIHKHWIHIWIRPGPLQSLSNFIPKNSVEMHDELGKLREVGVKNHFIPIKYFRQMGYTLDS